MNSVVRVRIGPYDCAVLVHTLTRAAEAAADPRNVKRRNGAIWIAQEAMGKVVCIEVTTCYRTAWHDHIGVSTVRRKIDYFGLSS